eukprot:gene26713-32281_t
MTSFGGNKYTNWSPQTTPPHSSTASKPEEIGYFSNMLAIRDSFASQLQDMTDSLPEAGPLSAAYRERLLNSIYLLLAASIFGALAVFVGLPTLILRPSKFVICISLSTLLAASSVIVMQKPSAFISSLTTGGISKSMPVIVLLVSQLATVYVTVFVHKYFFVLTAAAVQILCLLYYLASFIPGGVQGLHVLLRMMWALGSAAVKPLFYVAKATVMSCIRTVFS